jgi:hypothetical protein
MKTLSKVALLGSFILILSLNSCTKKEHSIFSFLASGSSDSDDFETITEVNEICEEGERERIVMEDNGNYEIISRSDMYGRENEDTINDQYGKSDEYKYLSNNTALQNSYDGEYCVQYLVSDQNEKHYLTVWSEMIKGKLYLCKKIDSTEEDGEEKEDEIECKSVTTYFNSGYITDSFKKDAILMANGKNDSINFENGTLFDTLHYTNGTEDNFTTEVWLHKDVPLGHIAKIVNKDGSSMEIVSFVGKNGQSGYCAGEEN